MTIPKISIVVPCYNSERYIGKTIESVLAQTFTEWEMTVVDDGSKDQSASVIQQYAARDARIRYIYQENKGVCAARNTGFKASTQETHYLLFLDADDCLESEMLKTASGYLDRHADIGLGRCEYVFIDRNDKRLDYDDHKYRYAPKGIWVHQIPRDCPDTPFMSVFTLCGIIPSISLIRRTVYAQSPGWDEDFGHHHEDTDLFLYLALISKVHYMPQQLVRRRRHPDQNTADPSKFLRQENKLYQKWNSGIGLTPEQKMIVRDAWRFRQGRLEPYLAFQRAKEYFRNGEYGKSIRFYLGGSRRYLGSFFV